MYKEAMIDDDQLLRRYAEESSEKAFGELVERYLDLVYCTAIRRVGGDSQLAQDVAQMVFSALARKARALSQGVVLGGWLYRHTCLVAAQTVRTERRRRVREQEAMAMKSTHTEPEPSWEHLAPYLDEAMQRLDERDRDAIVLRYFERRDLREVSQALSTTEEGARKRVSRAVEKLRGYFEHRGLTLSAGTLAGLLAGHAVTAAPAGLAATITSAAVAGTATAGVGVVQLLTEVLAASKAKVGLVSALCVASLATPPGFQYQSEARAQWTALNSVSSSEAHSSNQSMKKLPYLTLLPTLGAALSAGQAWSDDLIGNLNSGDLSAEMRIAPGQPAGSNSVSPALSPDEMSGLQLVRPRPLKYPLQSAPSSVNATANPAAKADASAVGERKLAGSTASDVNDLAAPKSSTASSVSPPEVPQAAPESKPVDVAPAVLQATAPVVPAAAPVVKKSSTLFTDIFRFDDGPAGSWTGSWTNGGFTVVISGVSSNSITNGAMVWTPGFGTNNVSPNGTWTLFVFDIGGTNGVSIVNWGLDFTPIALPTLRISRPAGGQSGSNLTLSWSGGSGIRLQKAAMAAKPSWHEVAGTDGKSSVSLPVEEPNAIFRLIRL